MLYIPSVRYSSVCTVLSMENLTHPYLYIASTDSMIINIYIRKFRKLCLLAKKLLCEKFWVVRHSDIQ